MNVEEIMISHALYGSPGKLYVTPDNSKLYFMLNGHLMYLEAETTFEGMNEDELNRVLQDAVLDLMNSRN